MELHLQPPSGVCFVSAHPFSEGDRVISFLVRDAAGEYLRCDCLASAEAAAELPGEILCRWSRTYKPPQIAENPEKELKMTAESLFLSLTVESAGGVEENAALKQFLALMLERKRVLKNRGRNADGSVIRYEHMRSKQIAEVPAGEMDMEFFVSVREKLGVLLGEPEAKVPAEAEAESAPEAEAGPDDDQTSA